MDLYKIRKELNMGIPLTSIKLRVTDYARVSTNHLEQQKSLQNQKEHFEEMIKENPNWTYITGYVDDGITGTSDVKRDNFMKMIDDAKNNKFDLIITKEISRFSRNTLDSIKYTRELLSYGVAVLFVNDNINTALPDAELRLTIMASMAQDEIRRLSERVKFGMNRAILRGEILGNNLLYGYKKDKNTKKLVIINEEADVVRRIFEWYAIDKLSLSEIVRRLNKDKILSRNSNKWSVTTISRMIENPKYKGFYCGRKIEVEDYMTKKIKYFNKDEWITYEDKEKIPPIIDSYLWEKANKRLNKRKKSKNKYHNKYLYSSKIYCKCHKTLYYRRIFRNKNKDVTWVCSEYLKYGKEYCNSANIRESELNYIFKDIINKLEIDLNKVVHILINYYQNSDFNKDEEIEKRKKKLNNIIIKKDKLLDLNIKEIISDQEFQKRNNMLNEEIKSIEEDINNIDDKNNNVTLEDDIRDKVYSNKVLERIINLILKHIDVTMVDKVISLDIYLNYDSKLELSNDYEFKRGFDTKGTKRYYVFYKVKVSN